MIRSTIHRLLGQEGTRSLGHHYPFRITGVHRCWGRWHWLFLAAESGPDSEDPNLTAISPAEGKCWTKRRAYRRLEGVKAEYWRRKFGGHPQCDRTLIPRGLWSSDRQCSNPGTVEIAPGQFVCSGHVVMDETNWEHEPDVDPVPSIR